MRKNDQPLTKEFCFNKTLIFSPTTVNEALSIQNSLMRLGFRWRDGEMASPQECVDKKIVLSKKGEIGINPTTLQLEVGLECAEGQFFAGFGAEEKDTSVDEEDAFPMDDAGMDEWAEVVADFKAMRGGTDYTPPPQQPPQEGKGKGLEDPQVLADAQAKIDGMIGIEEAKTDLSRLTAMARLNALKQEMGVGVDPISMHLVATGSPGTGKTTFVRNMAELYFALGLVDRPDVVEVTRNDLVGRYVGETEQKTMAKIYEARGGILFIDEAYALASDEEGKDFGHRAIETLVAAMENMRDNLIVVVAGYPDRMMDFINSNEGLRSRFTTYLNFKDFLPEQLGEILDQMVQDRSLLMQEDARTLAIDMVEAEKERDPASFANGRTVRNLVEQVQRIQAERLQREGVLDMPHERDDMDFLETLSTITAEDVAKVSLAGIQQKEKNAGVKIGFAAPRAAMQQAMVSA